MRCSTVWPHNHERAGGHYSRYRVNQWHCVRWRVLESEHGWFSCVWTNLLNNTSAHVRSHASSAARLLRRKRRHTVRLHFNAIFKMLFVKWRWIRHCIPKWLHYKMEPTVQHHQNGQADIELHACQALGRRTDCSCRKWPVGGLRPRAKSCQSL